MKNALLVLALFALSAATAALVSALPAQAAQLNTQSTANSAAPPDTEVQLFQDTPETKPAPAGKPVADNKPPTMATAKPAASQPSQAAAPDADAPHANAALSPVTTNAPRPPRLVAPPGW